MLRKLIGTRRTPKVEGFTGMQRNDRWPEDFDAEGQRSRPGSRRNSATLTRRSSLKKDKDIKKSPLSTAPHSANSTPKKVVKPNLDFMVTGKQILKRCDRANSLPGSYHRRPSADSIINPKPKKTFDSPKRAGNVSKSLKSQETSLEDDMSLDLSQVSDFGDVNSKHGSMKKFAALATSTPKSFPRQPQKPRSGSLQSQLHSQKLESARRVQTSLDSSKPSRESTFSYSRDSLYKNSSSASPNRYTTELDYSSVSPEYSGQSSTELSPQARRDLLSPSQEHVSSCSVSTWQDCSEIDNTKVDDVRGENGEWNNFWANYNNSISKVPMKTYYDQCPTPYRTDNIDFADLDFSLDGSRKRSPDNIKNLNNIICNEGLHLTPRETQNIIKCAHVLGNVLSKAIERRAKEKEEDKIHELKSETTEPELEIKKKTMTLDLKETVVPLEVKEEKRSETVTTQTDISLPNTKTAPKIFEHILRQLSKSSIDNPTKNTATNVDNKEEGDVQKDD